MKKGKLLLRIFGLLLILASLGGVVLLTSFHARNQDEQLCSDVHIHINHESGLFFLDEQDIRQLLATQLGDSIAGDRLNEIPLKSIERLIQNNPYTRETEIFLDANGELHINIVQKRPLARVINRYGVNYYITDQGGKIPVSGKFTCRVPVITGAIEEGIQNPDTIETQTLQNVLQLAHYLDTHSFWKSQIEQADVSALSEFTLVPKLGNQLIEFGTIDHIDIKFNNLELFYKKGLSMTSWDAYQTINVAYDGQVVCKKINTYEQQ